MLVIDSSWLPFAAGKGETSWTKRNVFANPATTRRSAACAQVLPIISILDPTIVRVLWALLAVFAGTGILAYFICALVMPEDDTQV